MNGELTVSYILRNDSAVTDLVSDRVYLNEADQGAALPYIILEERDVEPIDSKSGKAEKDVDIIGVFAYSASPKQLKNLAIAIRNALDHIDGTINGVSVDWIRFLGQTGFEEQLPNVKMHVKDQEYQIRFTI